MTAFSQGRQLAVDLPSSLLRGAVPSSSELGDLSTLAFNQLRQVCRRAGVSKEAELSQSPSDP
jgi:hypothetical protein